MLSAHKGTCTNAFIVISHNIYGSELSRLNDVLRKYTNQIMYTILFVNMTYVIILLVGMTTLGEALLAALAMTPEVWITRNTQHNAYFPHCFLQHPSVRLTGKSS